MTKVFIFLLLLACTSAFAQTPAGTAGSPSDTLKTVEILSTDRYGYQKLDSLQERLLLVGNVALKQETTLFYADSAIYNRSQKQVEAFGNVHINDNDSLDTYSDYLLYHTDTKVAILKKNVRLTDGKSNLFTEELEYDLNNRVGIYRQGGRVLNNNSILTSTEATYYADLKDVYFRQNVELTDPQYRLEADSLLYNTDSEIATFLTRTYIEDSAGRTVVTRSGYYDLKNKNASFRDRPVIRDEGVSIVANTVDTDDQTGVSVLTGNAVVTDSVQGFSVLANAIVSNRETGAMLATQRPLMIIRQEEDSVYVTGDTIEAGRLSDLQVRPRNILKDSAFISAFIAREQPRSAPAEGAPDRLLPRPDGPLRPNPAFPSEEPAPPASPSDKPAQAAGTDTTQPADRPAASADSAQTLAPMATPTDTASRTDTIRIYTDTLPPRDTARVPSPTLGIAMSDSTPAASQSQEDTAPRFFRVYRNVRIFSDSMQAVCDSLFYSGADSTFRMFYSPILWANNSQVTGDTVYLSTYHKKPDRLFVFEDGIMINQTGENMYNQLRGTRLLGQFQDGEINNIRAKGNAESVYYAKDEEERLIGVNKATANIIEMRFRNKELNRVAFISEATGTMLPVRQATEQDTRLRGFNWHEAKRPKSKFELFGD